MSDTATIGTNGATEMVIPATRKRGRPAGTTKANGASATVTPKTVNFSKILAQKLHQGPSDETLSEMAWDHAQEFVGTLDNPVDGFMVLLAAYRNYNKFHKNADSAESVNTLFDSLKAYALDHIDEGMIELVDLFQTVVNKANRATDTSDSGESND